MPEDTVQHLGVDFGHNFFINAIENNPDAKSLYEELLKQGLEPQPERSHVFSVYSPQSFKSIAISITPFSSRDLESEGGLSISEGGHAQAVIVEISGRTRIVGFTHLAVQDNRVISSKHDISELTRDKSGGHELAWRHIKTAAEKAGKIKSSRPLVEMEVHQVRSLASVAYNSLLGDRFSRTVHDDNEIAVLRGNTNLVSEIALFVLFRTSGSACCSCSCSCWGSSSCSSSAV